MISTGSILAGSSAMTMMPHHHHHPVDENAVAAVMNAKTLDASSELVVVSKTPAAAKASAAAATARTGGNRLQHHQQRRVAFGDISNRKTAPLKTVSFVSKTPAAARTPFVSRTDGLLRNNDNNKLPEEEESESLVLKKQPHPLSSNRFTTNTGAEAGPAITKVDPSKLEDVEPVEEIEYSAGRTWVDEQALLLDDDSTVLSLEGAATAREDLMALFDKRHQYNIKWEEEQEQQCLVNLDAHVAHVMATADEDFAIVVPFDFADDDEYDDELELSIGGLFLDDNDSHPVSSYYPSQDISF